MARKKAAKANEIDKVNRFFANKSPLRAAQEAVSALLGVSPETASAMSMTKCKKALTNVYINIYDYVAGKYKKQVLTLRALFQRCNKRGYYPKEAAKDEGLKVLLKCFFTPVQSRA